MQQKHLKKAATKHIRSAKRALLSFIKKGDQEKLHRFRTSVKKLRALAQMAGQASRASRLLRSLKPIGKIYKPGGKIRDCYQHLELGKQEQAGPGYLADQEDQMEKAIVLFCRDKKKHLKRIRRSKKSLLKKLRPVKDIKLTLFYEQELRAVAEVFNNNPNDEELHTGRKRIKVLLYNLPLVRHILNMPVSEDYLDEVQTAIGNWHDLLLAGEIFPVLQKKAQTLRDQLCHQTNDFYDRATGPVAPVHQQID
ncbi:MAG: CHAD domain-containing protein [Mucilaginibacter sp.]